MTRGRKQILYVCAALCLLVLVGVTGLYFYGKRKLENVGPQARKRIIHALEQRFNADVGLQSLQIVVYPRPQAIGEGLTIRHKGWPDAHPLISIRRFSAETDYDTVMAKKNHIDLVRLEGLEIHVPARGRSALIKGIEQNYPVESAEPGQDTTRLQFLIETIVADGTLLEIEPKIEGKPPLQFDIQKLTLHSVGTGQPMRFDAVLTNAKPPGLINSTGRFGPWQKDDPRATAVSGNYTFENVNLGAFKGISGILSSVGNYHGVLQHIQVDGATDTPNFALKRGGDPVHLVTKFHSVVNGTDGDTILDPVDARFLHSEFVCGGGIVHHPGPQGKTVSLEVVARHARMEDILHLIIGRGKPFVTGAVNFRSKILIPPGHEDVLDKLNLDGEFNLSSAEFTSPDAERRLQTLSSRARGISKKEEEEEPPQTVASDLEGRFRLNAGITSFSTLQFSVPGAAISLTGKYDLKSEQIDMSGKFRMQATLSATQSGVKHWILKPFDRFFEKEGAGFEVPITVSGTRDHPEIGTEIFHRHVTIH
ncbi:MAG: hypothetical protein JO091_10330 [Acidobacteriaceae bacterium]|nr:hypothetical protein [Acidobacteriaceae bacterium]